MQVRLWVDDLASFRRMQPEVDVALAQQMVAGVSVGHWTAAFPAAVPADIVIEGFGVRLPDVYIEAMVGRTPAPVWINLEYLSAEAWVDSHHGLPSPHPRLPLTKYFFFPGFTRATGGVLIEDRLAQQRAEFQADNAAIQACRRGLGIMTDDARGLWLSLFCYENAALTGLVAAWSADSGRVHCVVPEGYALTQMEAIAGRRIVPGTAATLGSLTVHAIRFLDQPGYDRLLWSCDANFVRGEDSFVRAQLAARPLVWQAYPQDEESHLQKAAAFRARYFAGLEAATVGSYERLFDSWNRQTPDCGSLWPEFRRNLGQYTQNAANWALQIAENGDLAANLAKFCLDRLE